MRIDFTDVQNFRRLKNCRIYFSDKETVFVGPNNSGKTTAMDALIIFFKAKKFTTRDFTLSNWKHLNAICEEWLKESDVAKIDLKIDKWEEHLPTLDVWLSVKPTEIHYVSHLIPTLSWTGGSLGIRLRFEPVDVSALYKEFYSICGNARKMSAAKKKGTPGFSLWPKDMWDFLEKRLHEFFTIKTYLLDPACKTTVQKLPANSLPLDTDALKGLIKVDIINAQRGFTDVNTEGGETTGTQKNLSNQLRNYYEKHLNPELNTTEKDVEALRAMEDAKKLFEENLKESFKSAIGELEGLNYPGFGNPTISLASNINTTESLKHDSSVRYSLGDEGAELSLPEKYNGLGYQNLISMIFKLIRFRDEWMQVGKSYRPSSTASAIPEFEPLHLVLIEEPEAHLHAQVQQVFIREAYRVLRSNNNLLDDKFITQLVISTHSNHIAHEIDFTSLRYFKREQAAGQSIATSKVINLSNTFGNNDDTTKFAVRYLRTTHCDLFFADAVILVEGPAERMLVPYFIRHHTDLNNAYISILEIGGSHAHTLKPLIESLGIITLIITDLDAVNPAANNSKVQPDKGKGYKTGNDTLKKWLPVADELDKLLALDFAKKQDAGFPVRVAYQTTIKLKEGAKEIEVYPYTFEDSLVLTNKSIFEALTSGTGLLKKMINAAKETDVKKAAKEMYDAITDKGAKKAEFALDLFYFNEPNILITPAYIKEGLDWLEERLKPKKKDVKPVTQKTKK
ncbi:MULTISPECIES: AAA family ATPase [Hydrotalea]|uniref:ATP-dependent nuclease n=1 Tax=Hydrotalea TaxID=1004300 RepID=UPI00083450B3|nr:MULTISPECIES: AAA family ATPase [Hydrotalea]RTL53321.1 MAG: ATP-dependent endonuclease [Sphingobacteriales bacterium]RWZ86237.1 MAG: ATP-dependent endonuclease [Hydrotalea sp. AMD]